MIINYKTNQECKVFIDGTKLKQQQSFKYLVTLFTQDGTGHSEVNARIGQPKLIFQRMWTLLTNKNMLVAMRQRENRSSGDMVLEENVKNTMDSKKTNVDVMEEAGEIRLLVNRIIL